MCLLVLQVAEELDEARVPVGSQAGRAVIDRSYLQTEEKYLKISTACLVDVPLACKPLQKPHKLLPFLQLFSAIRLVLWCCPQR